MAIVNAPTDIVAVGGIGVISLTWTPVAEATNYYIMRSTVSGGAYKIVGTAVNPTFEDPLESKMDLNTYYYVITAENAEGESEPSIEVAAAGLPWYTKTSVYIHPRYWSGGAVPQAILEGVAKGYNVLGKRQSILTEAPLLSVVTYND